MKIITPHPYKVGDAVFYVYDRGIYEFALQSGTITRIGKRITIRTDTGLRRVSPRYLVYARHCLQCRSCGATSPTCPACGSAIVDAPPPLDTVALLFPPEWNGHEPVAWFWHAMARAIATGGTMEDGCTILRNWRRYNCSVPPGRARDIMRQLGALFLDDDPGNTGLNLPPPWQPPADDQEPDSNTNDQITQWLRRQFAEKGGE